MDSTQSTKPESFIDEDGWITGPALETAIAIGAILPGDMVMVKPVEGQRDTVGLTDRHRVSWTIPHKVLPDLKHGSSKFVCTINGDGYSDRWWLIEENVAAWQPQKR